LINRLAGIFVILLILTIPTISSFEQTPTVNKIHVIILFKEKPTDKHRHEVESVGGDIKRTFKIINAYAADLPQEEIDNLKHNPLVSSIDADLEVKALDTSADTQIRADQVWAAGDTGTGVPVAILDTGIATAHPEFSGRIVQCHSEIPNIDPNTCEDQFGHGTHVAGIVGAAGINPSAKGVAPSVSFYSDQVLDSTGSGSISGIISGIDWAIAKNARVISMSLGTTPIVTTQPNCDTAIPSLTTAINNAVASGITVVAAAGNSGSQGVGAPGCISSTIAVAAVDSTNTIASFSSRGGPLTDHGIAAPGVNIFSSVPTGSCALCNPSGYATLSGTSMATPHVAGTIALLLKANPALSPAQIKNILFSNACTGSTSPSCPTGTVPNPVYGFGRIDALRAYNSVSTPPLPDFAISASPSSLTINSGSSGSSTITVTSINGFSGTISLSSSTGSTLGAPSLSVSSGGTASTTLTITNPPSSRTYSVTGTSGSLTHSTTITVTVLSVPSAPQNLVATAGNAIVTLKWNAPSSNGGSAISGYKVYRGTTTGGEGTTSIGTATTTSYTDSAGLTNGQAYYYKVSAVNSVGESLQSNEANATPTIQKLSVSVTTNKSTYLHGTTATISVTVTNSTPVSGASVTLTIKDPNGGTTLRTGTTNSNGHVNLYYYIGKQAPSGTYTASVTATKTGYASGSASTTFSVN
jgi:subtilisin